MSAGIELLPRRLHVFFTAILVYVAIKLTEKFLRLRKVFSGASKEPVWSRTHRWCARRLLNLAVRRQGLWVKCCQYVAARGDVLPDEYINILSECLDSCPPEPPHIVRHVVRSELASIGHDVEDVFEEFDPNSPIASASIAQVHRAKLKTSGHDVVLKVQRPGIRPLLLQDLQDLGTVLTKVAGAEPEFDLRPMLQAWLDMVPLETDFVHESRNSEQISKILQDAKGTKFETEAFVPRCFEEYTTERLLVVEYVHGCSVKDTQAMDLAGVDKERFVAEITKAFALQAHVLGMINADAHPGNVLVQFHQDGSAGGFPALIDFGITVKLTDGQRLAFCKTIVAAVENNSLLLLQSFEEMGIVFNRVDPQASMDVIKHLFRSTASREETVAQSKEFRRRHKDRDALNIDSGVAPGTTRNTPRSSPGDGKEGEHRGTGFKKKAASRSQVTAKKQNVRRNPIDAFPGFLVFMFRTIGLLRGLSGRLGVTHSYLPILYQYSSQALKDACPDDEKMQSTVFVDSNRAALPRSTKTRRAGRLNRIVSKVLKQLEQRGFIVGCQVAVYMDGEVILDMAAGRLGKHNWRPVRPSTLFNAFSVTKGVMSVLFASIADEFNIRPSDKVCDHWPAFRSNGKEFTTVGHILSHRAALAQAAPEDMSMVRLRDDWQGIVDWLAEQAAPAYIPGSKQEYHYLTFGWLLAGIMQSVTGESVQKNWRSFAQTLGIEDECFLGLPDELCSEVANGRIATIHSEFVSDIQKLLQRRHSRTPSSSAAAESDLAGTQGANMENLYDESLSSAEGARALYRQFFQNAESNAESAAVVGGEVHPSQATQDRFMDDFLTRAPYLLEPQYFSHPVMRAAVIPSANGHFSARALAKIYSMVANDGVIDGKTILRRGCAARMMETLSEPDNDDEEGTGAISGGDAYGAGVRLYDVVDLRGRVLSKKAMGHAGIGGSFAFCIPDAKFSFAFTCNQLNAFSVAESVLVGVVCAVLKVPTPRAHAEVMQRLRRRMRTSDDIMADLDSEIDLALENLSVSRVMTG